MAQQLTGIKVEEKQENTQFNLFEATLYGINVVLGTGILLLPRNIYENLGPASIVAMIFSAVLVLLLALCFAEVAGYVSKNGGAYAFAKIAFGDRTSFIIGILSWFTVTTVWGTTSAGLAELLGHTFEVVRGREPFVAILFIVFFMILNLGGLKITKTFSNIVTVSKLLPFIVVGAIGIAFFYGGVQAGNWTPFVQVQEGASFTTQLATTAMIVFYAFVGFESLPIIGGEVKNSKRNMPKAILISLVIVTALYVLLIGTTISVLGDDLMNTGTPIQDTFALMVGDWGFWFVNIAAMISLVGLCAGDSIHSPRLLESIAEDSVLPDIVTKKNNAGTPYVAIIITSLVALLMVLTGSFEELAALSVVFYFFQYIPTAFAVYVLRKKQKNGELAEEYSNEGQFKLPGGMTIPIIAIVVSLWMILLDSLAHLVTAIVGIVVVLIIYEIFRRVGKDNYSTDE